VKYLGIGVVVAALCLGGVRSERPYTFQRENVLGTSFELKVAAASAEAAQRAEAAAIREIGHEAAILSSWDASSEFSRWSRTRNQAVKVSPELLEVLGMFDTWRARTGGALDASAEVVSRAWKRAAEQGRTPTAAERSAAVAEVRQQHWSLAPKAGTVTHLTATPLALNTFVKSYIMDHAANAVLATPGVTGAVLNIGGDLVVRGAWSEPVRIADPRSDEENGAPVEQIQARDRAVATSGGYRRGFDIDGKHYSHIVDPRTGETTGHILSATVIAPKAADAGALATAFCVLTPQESAKVAATVPGAEYLLIAANGSRIASRGWASTRPVLYVPQAAAADAMEVAMTLELAQIGGFARRPYVAVWIEDKDHFPVRTLALWYQKPRWLPELHAWYRDDRMRAMAEGNEIAGSIASATRPPGKYTLKWDGKDNSGKAVKPGKYTVCIEAAREHGTYQIIRQEIEWGGGPRLFQLPGNQEIASATVDYRKAAH
jgi:thiamine biosynthesis lipoprotein ApbE